MKKIIFLIGFLLCTGEGLLDSPVAFVLMVSGLAAVAFIGWEAEYDRS